MATWHEIGIENFQAAVSLYEDAKKYRSAASRFYYAVFSILTEELIQRHADKDFSGGRSTPGHRQLPDLIEIHFMHFSLEKRANLAKYVRNLYRDRITADYSLFRVDKQSARSSFRSAQKIFEYMGTRHERR